MAPLLFLERSSRSSSPRSTRKMDPQEPRAASSGIWLVGASVSPVGVKKKVRKLEFGSQAIFSGRLNGVAPAAFASAVAEPKLTALSFGGVAIVTQLIGYDVPGVCSLSC